MRHTSVNETKMRSPLMDALILKPRKKAFKKKVVAALILTSLVDAFSIMLLYLLCQPSGNGSTLELNKTENLPSAVKTDVIHKGTVVRVEGDKYFLADQPVEQVQLAQKLQQLKASFGGREDDETQSIVIQADRGVDFAMLAPVVRAGSITGFHKFKFAVLQEEGSL